MPPTTKIGGGGWSCGARAKHHHRKRLRDPEFLTIRTTTYGVASSSCRASQRQQRQQLAPRATSRWRGGAKQIALAPREGQALEERSSCSRLTRRPRTRGQQLPCVRRRQRQQLAPRASRWRRGGAKQIALAPREGQALKEDPVRLVGTSRIGAFASSSRASPRRQRRQLARDRRGEQTSTPGMCSQSTGATSLPPKARGRSRSSTCAASRTNAVRHHDDSGVRRRHTTTTAARARGARRSLRSRGAAARRFRTTENKELRRQLERAAANQGGQHARRASS